ncbi:magnesium transporter [Streptococcus sp. H31]|uniref:magnesium transporter n=2 Tax=Streptococcus huangxiaojuni TaxID=3237239 RepID=UPI0034A32F86
MPLSISKAEMEEMQAFVKHSHRVDLSAYMLELEPEKRALMLRFFSKEQLAELFAELPAEDKINLIESLAQVDLPDILAELDSDELVDSLQELPSNLVTKLLLHIPENRRQVINRLLNYPEDSVGSLMSADYIAVRKRAKVSEVLEKLKMSTAGHEHLNTIFVIDDERRLNGHLYLADLLRLDTEDLSSIIHWRPLTVTTGADQEEAAKLFHKYSLLVLPVCDSEQRLVGIITADDIFEVISEEIYEDYALMQGMAPSENSYLETSVITLAKKRIVWLLFLMLSATVTGGIIEHYEAVLSTAVALTAFIPMLMDSGGNSGSQSSTLIIQSLALDELDFSDSLRVVWKEFRVGLLVGTVLAIVNILRMFLFTDTDFLVMLTVSVTLLLTIILAKLVGGILPLLAKKLKQDPAVMAGPLVTTIVDACALLIYFKVAQILIGL